MRPGCLQVSFALWDISRISHAAFWLIDHLIIRRFVAMLFIQLQWGHDFSAVEMAAIFRPL
jgi:hypothetical protein